MTLWKGGQTRPLWPSKSAYPEKRNYNKEHLKNLDNKVTLS